MTGRGRVGLSLLGLAVAALVAVLLLAVPRGNRGVEVDRLGSDAGGAPSSVPPRPPEGSMAPSHATAPPPAASSGAGRAAAPEERDGVRIGREADPPRERQADPTTIRERRSAVEGWVVDEEGRAVGGAEVELLLAGTADGVASWRPEARVEVVQPDGSFTLRDAPERGALRARASIDRSASLPVEFDGASRTLSLRVSRRAGIVGRVFGAEGRPEVGVVVRATSSGPTVPPATWDDSARTDDAGGFALRVPPGVAEVDLFVSSPQANGAERPAGFGAREHVVPSGAREVRIDLRPFPGIEGIVRARDGTPLDALVVGIGKGTPERITTRAGRDGRFRLGPLAAGAWRVTARPDGQVGTDASGRTLDGSPEAEFDASAVGVELRCDPATHVEGVRAR